MNESEQVISASIEDRMAWYAAIARRDYDSMGGVRTMPRKRPGGTKRGTKQGTKQLKALAKRLRQAERDIKRLQECLPLGGDLLSGNRNTAAEVGHLASVVEMTFKAGRPVNLHLMFSSP